jgi:hypothetical protein
MGGRQSELSVQLSTTTDNVDNSQMFRLGWGLSVTGERVNK